MNTGAVEKFMATLYTDAGALERFLRAPRDEAARAGLSAAECEALAQADMTGLQMAARSFSHKRTETAEGAASRSRGRWGWRAIRGWFRG